jgi:hypothetical protein
MQTVAREGHDLRAVAQHHARLRLFLLSCQLAGVRQHEVPAVGAPPTPAQPPAVPGKGAAPTAVAAVGGGGGGGKKKLGGLKLAVGSQMDTGEWTSHGQFLKKDKAGTEIPNGLQQIKADDLVKVIWPGGARCRMARWAQQPHGRCLSQAQLFAWGVKGQCWAVVLVVLCWVTFVSGSPQAAADPGCLCMCRGCLRSRSWAAAALAACGWPSGGASRWH